MLARLTPLIVVAAAGALAACGGDEEPPPVAPHAAMTTVAGGGKEHGDHGPATSARFCGTSDVAFDAQGSMYIADGGANCSGPGGHTVRKVDPQGIITTVAGTGEPDFSGDGGPATSATLNVPIAVAVGPKGSLYISDWENFRIRRVDPDGTITTIAGTGDKGHSGDGGPARSARLSDPGGLAFDARGRLHVADHGAVRRIDRSGTIVTVAGTGKVGFSGDGGQATDARMAVSDVAFDGQGSMYLSDTLHHRVRRVDADGVITTVAGSGELAPLGDGGPATSAAVDFPVGVAVDRTGNLLIAEHHGNRIRKVDPHGTITTIAGTGQIGFSGERGPATELQLNQPWGLYVGEPGLLYVADAFNARIRAVRYHD